MNVAIIWAMTKISIRMAETSVEDMIPYSPRAKESISNLPVKTQVYIKKFVFAKIKIGLSLSLIILVLLWSGYKGGVMRYNIKAFSLPRPRRFSFYDLIAIAILILAVMLIVSLAHRWSEPFKPQTHIYLDSYHLLKYTIFSMARGFAAYFLSLIFTLVVGYAAAKNRYLERVIIPTLDILQSVPVLGFLPGLMIALISLFPHREIGLELVSIIMIFTGQVWNMTFSFYQSLKSTPRELVEAASVYNMSKLGIFLNVEIPYAMPGLVYNSMMSMAGGWFFLTVCEAFTLGNHTYTIPGIGSYMAKAIEKGYVAQQIYGIMAMIGMIVFIDIVFWKPIVAWSSKFSPKADAEESGSVVLNILMKSHVIRFFRHLFKGDVTLRFRRKNTAGFVYSTGHSSPVAEFVFYLFMAAVVFLGVHELLSVVGKIKPHRVVRILECDGITALRVYLSVALSVMWTLPVGILIGKNRKLSSRLQPVIQIAASFPAPLIYPWFVMLFPQLDYSSVLLMMLGTQWYILFNVIAGASTVPSELEDASDVFGIRGFRRFLNLYIPVVFPYLVTGIITAAGGAWNASIVAEYLSVKGRIFQATGIGALVNIFTDKGELHLLAVSIIVMSLSVVIINRAIWRPLQRYAAERFSVE